MSLRTGRRRFLSKLMVLDGREKMEVCAGPSHLLQHLRPTCCSFCTQSRCKEGDLHSLP